MWDSSIAFIIWGIPWWASISWAKTLNWVGLENYTKFPCKLTLINLQKNWTIFEIILSATPYITPIVYKVFIVRSLCNDIATLLSTAIVSLIRVVFLCKYGPNLSQRNLNVLWHTWVLCLNIFLWKSPIITYRWTLHSSQMPTYYDHSSSYPQRKCSKLGHFPILRWVPMLAYQARVAQSCANTNMKPMQQESSLFSQYDPSCSLFLPHRWKTQKKVKKERMKICS